MFRSGLFFLVLSLSACSQLAKEDCAHIDWFELGRKDGEVGHRSTMFIQHSLKCSKAPEASTYKEGRKLGLKKFCTLEGGVDYGLNGSLYIGQCSDYGDKAIKAFKLGLDKGRQVYRQNELINELDQKLKDIKFELGTSFHERAQVRDLEIQKQSLETEIKSERIFLNQLIKGLPPRNNPQ